MTLVQRFPGSRVLVLEKEPFVARHQTGHNSGVIHSGIYYKPGSFKAEFSKKGRESIVAFCQAQGLPYDLCGKIIVATDESELPRLQALYERGLQNGLAVTRLTPAEAREIEPSVSCIAALRVPETGITDFKLVSKKYAELIVAGGGEVRLGSPVVSISRSSSGEFRITTPAGEVQTKFLINCAGLFSDRVARMAGEDPGVRIVPFRGEYYELTPERRSLVRALIYPVPNPDFPFLGVHFTRMIDGEVHAGPNAVLALKREGYSWQDFNARDLFETLSYAGFWKLASKNLREGSKEVVRSLSRAAFLRSLQRLIPSLSDSDIQPSGAGVRAQALLPDGKLVDDFMLVEKPGAIHVLNAPSPAATCSIEIGKWVGGRVGVAV